MFVDRRIGENDSRMDPEKKIALRLAAEKKRQFSRVSTNILSARAVFIIWEQSRTIFFEEIIENWVLKILYAIL